MKNGSFLRNSWDLILVLILYSLLAVFLLKYYQYNISGDEISYINIARAYAMGNWGDAVNGYWSPLFSWLLTPFLLSGSTPLFAVYVSKIGCLIIGFFTIISIRRLSNKFEMNTAVKTAILFSTVPAILFFSLKYNTPDLLVAFILIYYLSILFDPEYSNNWFNGFSCGFVGALAYLSKSYVFFFFIFHFFFFNLIYYFKGFNKQEKSKILKNLFLGFLVFFMISGLWIGTISDKYGKITISTSGEFNQALMGPKYSTNPTEYIKHPIYYYGLIKPPNKSAISIWDDLSYIEMKQWSPFDSRENFEHELKLIWQNIIRTAIIIEYFFLISVVIIIASLLFIFRYHSKKTLKDRLIYLLITMIIYLGGYCLIAVEWRYFWFVFILLMVTGFYLIDSLYKSRIFTETFRNILLIILICSFIIQPVNELFLYSSTDEGAYGLSNTLKTDYGISGNIASNDEWGEMISISYYLNSKYYGITKKTTNYQDLQRELEDNNIDYYFVWHKTDDIQLSDYREITGGKIYDLRIYSKIKNN
jgi:hypothetical protein